MGQGLRDGFDGTVRIIPSTDRHSGFMAIIVTASRLPGIIHHSSSGMPALAATLRLGAFPLSACPKIFHVCTFSHHPDFSQVGGQHVGDVGQPRMQ